MKIKEAITHYNKKSSIPRLRLGLSQIGHPCQQYLLNKYKGIPEQYIATTNQLTFDIGNFIEEKLFNIFNEYHLSYTYSNNLSLRVEEELVLDMGNISLYGHLDGMIYKHNEKLAIWECKTMNQTGFNKLLKYGYENYSPEYRAQLHAYMMASGVKEAYVTVFCKNDSKIYEETITYNEDYTVSLLSELAKILNEEIKPYKECVSSNYWKVPYCGYGCLCFKENE